MTTLIAALRQASPERIFIAGGMISVGWFMLCIGIGVLFGAND
jgi:hypothetical protein